MPPIPSNQDDGSLGLSWLRSERRQHPSIEEQVGLFRYQITQVAARTEDNRAAVNQVHEDLCKLIERINRMEAHHAREEQAIKQLLADVRFASRLWKLVVIVGGGIATIVTALYHGYGLIDFFK